MTRQIRWTLGAIALAACTTIAAVTATRGQSAPTATTAQAGGIYRLGTEDFGFTNAFDPTGEYLGLAWGYYRNLLIRGAVTYRHTAGGPGNEIVPDIAETLPTTSDGRTWTIKLKTGVKFAPPVNRLITSKDFVYAFERIGTPSLEAQYGFYFDDIQGMQAFRNGSATTISGLATPDDQTLVISLTRPVGDFVQRLALPAAFPIPPEVGKCFTRAGDYGRFLIASGPYMLQGTDALNISSCAAMRASPIAGFDPTARMSMVRNPNYDPATDSPTVREALPDGFTIDIITDPNLIFAKIERGELEGSPDTPANAIIRRYAADPALRDRLKTFDGDRTWYITMNLTQPPFDDVHVRKAVNLIMNKAALRRAWGGASAGKIARHIVPDSVYLGGTFTPASYDPYRTPGDAGSLARAKAQMRLSRYDTNKDGICDAPACRNIVHVTRNLPQWQGMAPVIQGSLGKIGLKLKTRKLGTGPAYIAIQTVSRKVAIGSNPGWGKDFADPSTFMNLLFRGSFIIPTGNSNDSLVGLTRSRAKALGVKLPASGPPPSVDRDITRCEVIFEPVRRNACWVALDKKLMEKVVPWVPYLFASSVEVVGPSVTQYVYDQSSDEMAFAHVAVDVTKQR